MYFYFPYTAITRANLHKSTIYWISSTFIYWFNSLKSQIKVCKIQNKMHRPRISHEMKFIFAQVQLIAKSDNAIKKCKQYSDKWGYYKKFSTFTGKFWQQYTHTCMAAALDCNLISLFQNAPAKSFATNIRNEYTWCCCIMLSIKNLKMFCN